MIVQPEPIDFPENYEPTRKEIVDIIGGGDILWNSAEAIIKLYVASIDPNGDYPNLEQDLIDAAKNDPEFAEKLLELYEPEITQPPSDPSSPPPPANDKQGAVDWLNDFIGKAAAAIVPTLSEEAVKNKITDVTDNIAKQAKAANDNIPDIIRNAADDALGAVKAFGGLLTALDITLGVAKVVGSGWDPKVAFTQYGSLLLGAAAIASAPVWAPLVGLTTLGGTITAAVGTMLFGEQFAEGLANIIEAAVKEGIDIYQAAKEFIEGGIEQLPQIAKVMEVLWDATLDTAAKTGDQILQKINDAIAAGKDVIDAIAEAMEEIKDDFVDLVNDAIDAAVAAGEMAADVAARAADAVAKTVNSVVDSIIKTAQEAYDAAVAAGEDAAEAIARIANDLAEGFSEMMGQVEKALGDLGNAILDAADLAGQILDGALEALGGFLGDAAEALGSALKAAGDWLDGAWEAFKEAIWTGSPLVLDLDGDGIELISLDNTNIYWDIDQDGFAEASGWVTADDGFLAIDLNGDGVVSGHEELFGNLTTDGFTLLAVYDSNSDNVIDANDAQFDDLIVWRDLNQNGISETDEIFTLTDLGITSINLNATTPNNMEIEGHHISHVSTYTMTDQSGATIVRDIVDVWFDYSNLNTVYRDDYTLDLAALFLPNLRGYGDLPSLHIAISNDNDVTDPNSLMSLMNEFAQKDLFDLLTDDRAGVSLVRDILFRWAGVEDVDPASRGVWLNDARELEFLESLLGQEYKQGGEFGNPNPWSLGARAVERAFEIALYPITGKLIAQAAGQELFNDGFYYDPITDSFVGYTGLNQDTLDALLAQSNDGNEVADKTMFWINVINMIDASVGVDNLSADDLAALNTALATSDASLNADDLLARLQQNHDDLDHDSPVGETVYADNSGVTFGGGIGYDYYYGGDGADEISGGLGNDTIDGHDGDDILFGGLGDDYLTSGVGNDIYKYDYGHGNDLIGNIYGADKILFGEGISVSDLSFSRIVGGHDVLISIGPNSGNGSIRIQGQAAGSKISLLEFADGSTLDLNTINWTLNGSENGDFIYGVPIGNGGTGVDTIYGNGGNDTIYGNSAGAYGTAENFLYGGDGDDKFYGDNGIDTITGDNGSDLLYGYSGDDLITGGQGDDGLFGGVGSDNYFFNYGDGNDLIHELGAVSDLDVITFGVGITTDMISLKRVGVRDVEVSIDNGNGGSILLKDQVNYSAARVTEKLVFENGDEINLTTIDWEMHGSEAADALYGVRPDIGGSGNDTIYGYGGNDLIYGYSGAYSTTTINYIDAGQGNDRVYGDNGADTLIGGDGDDQIYANLGDDIITGGTGNDILQGGYGSDVYHFAYGDGDDNLYDFGHAIDVNEIAFGAGITQSMISFERLSHLDLKIVVDGGAGGSIHVVRQTNYSLGNGIDKITFENGDELLFSNIDLSYHGNDYANSLGGVQPGLGGSGNDLLYGYGGNDTLHGGVGDDLLNGGAGVDTLLGGTGADTFVFDDLNAVDTVQDFSLAQGDLLNLSDLISGYDPLTDAISDFVQITDNGTHSELFVDADGGADNFVQIATLNNVTGLDEDALESSGNLIAA